MREYELVPKFENASSYYGKVKVSETDNSTTLYSYNTKVAELVKTAEDDYDVLIYNVPKVFSKTSLRHIKEFLKQNGLDVTTKSDILKVCTLINI